MSKSDDLIRRSDAIEAVRTAKAVFDTTLEPYIKPQDAVDALSALPSAEAVHKPDYSYEAGMVRRLKEALSAKATTGDYPNDLISRSALMKYCSNQKSKSIDNNDIARFPSAEVEVYEDYEHATLVDIKAPLRESTEAIHGEWIEVEVFPEVYDIEGVKTWGSEMQCDQCGFRHTAIEGHMAQYNFCPNCGADMRGEKHE